MDIKHSFETVLVPEQLIYTTENHWNPLVISVLKDVQIPLLQDVCSDSAKGIYPRDSSPEAFTCWEE